MPARMRIVVVARNDESTIQSCLDALAASVETAGAPTSVVVVDRGSDDATADVAVRHHLPEDVVVTGEIGLDRAIRRGGVGRGVDVVAVIAAHLRPAPGWVGAARAAFPDRRGAGEDRPDLTWGPDRSVANVAVDRSRVTSVDLFAGTADPGVVERRLGSLGARSVTSPGMKVEPAVAARPAPSGQRPSPAPVANPAGPVHEGRLSVVVCTRDRANLLPDCLASLRDLEDRDHEILVIDNHRVPTVDTRCLPPTARVVHEPRPGLDVARNRGAREATGEIVVYIDDDCVADPYWLHGIRRAFGDEDVAMVTGRVRPYSLARPSERWFESHFTFDRGVEPLRFTPWDRRGWFPMRSGVVGTGCNMAFRRHVLDRLGGFDELLDMGTTIQGGGDLDMFVRVFDRGFIADYVPDALVWHRHRTDRATLRRQFLGYGTSNGALMTKAVLDWPGRRRQALSYGRSRARALVRTMRRARRGLSPVPPSLLALELFGLLRGPFVYAWARATAPRARR